MNASLPPLPRPAPLVALPPPSKGDKARRLVWTVVWALAYRLVPVPFFGVRRAILRLFGATMHEGTRVYPSARIRAPWNLEMRRFSCIAGEVECYNVARVVLHENVTVSQRAHLCTASHDFRTDDFTLVAAPIVIERSAWVAADAFLGPGVTVGRRAVVGARAVVTRSVPAGIVVAGNPARAVGTRARHASAPAP